MAMCGLIFTGLSWFLALENNKNFIDSNATFSVPWTDN